MTIFFYEISYERNRIINWRCSDVPAPTLIASQVQSQLSQVNRRVSSSSPCPSPTGLPCRWLAAAARALAGGRDGGDDETVRPKLGALPCPARPRACSFVAGYKRRLRLRATCTVHVRGLIGPTRCCSHKTNAARAEARKEAGSTPGLVGEVMQATCGPARLLLGNSTHRGDHTWGPSLLACPREHRAVGGF